MYCCCMRVVQSIEHLFVKIIVEQLNGNSLMFAGCGLLH